ncbi:sec-independent protein translocase protein TatA [Nocardioides cavernae]|uniref:Sec-independent protein translocase protein TatA n=1 Tax=Nocardioides cavernae TaxID=1921566 RepID=A0A7Y9H6F8_9ACTN|nr:twin-arginine translocase TatA/TatE family subunit [Nocardioides cavernae]NYE38568.1 sec-independent protein translocase protein TatA [Nocardioides cavernae]
MTSPITPLLVGGLGGMELLIILAVLVLLFGASKLPELARGSGQALKIFKAETKGLIDGDDKDGTKAATDAQVRTDAAAGTGRAVPAPVSEPIVVETPREHDVHRG